MLITEAPAAGVGKRRLPVTSHISSPSLAATSSAAAAQNHQVIILLLFIAVRCWRASVVSLQAACDAVSLQTSNIIDLFTCLCLCVSRISIKTMKHRGPNWEGHCLQLYITRKLAIANRTCVSGKNYNEWAIVW